MTNSLLLHGLCNVARKPIPSSGGTQSPALYLGSFVICCNHQNVAKMPAVPDLSLIPRGLACLQASARTPSCCRALRTSRGMSDHLEQRTVMQADDILDQPHPPPPTEPSGVGSYVSEQTEPLLTQISTTTYLANRMRKSKCFLLLATEGFFLPYPSPSPSPTPATEVLPLLCAVQGCACTARSWH